MTILRVTAIIALSLSIAGCDGKAAPTPATKPVLVSVFEVQSTLADGGLRATGTIRARRETALSFTSPGRVAAILVEEGQQIRRGELLARLDSTGIAAGASAARAEMVRAQAELARMKALAAKGWVTRPRVEAAEAAEAAARAQVAATSFDERFARIHAPAGGVVLRRHVEPNQTVAAGTPVLSIAEASGGYVLRVPLPDADLAGLQLGQGAAVTIPALGERPFAAAVSEIAARGDERTGTFEVELALPATAGLRSGLIAEARIRVPGRGSAVAVPTSALFQARADEGFVYVVDRGIARARVVQVGAVNDREVLVTGGLNAGERVIRTGVDRVRDGVAVSMRPAPRA